MILSTRVNNRRTVVGMATSEPLQPITISDVRHQLEQAERLIQAWLGRLPAEGDLDSAIAHEAARIATITQATVTQAACDTRAITERVDTGRPHLRVVRA